MTLRDIAEKVNLSVSAVSMALQDHPRIGTDTRLRVKGMAKTLGYVPNSAARALRVRAAGAIAVIVPNTGQHVFGHAYFMHVLTGVTQVANEKDAQVIISTNPDESHGMAAYERVIRSGSVDGAIVTSAAVQDNNIGDLLSSGIPVVLVGRFPYFPEAVSVGVDDEAAAYAATEHLILAHSRTSLLHLSGPLDHQSAIDRRNGFIAAADRHDVMAEVVLGDYSEDSGRVAVEAVRTIRHTVDGIFAANDEMAFGAMTRLTELGRAVPTQISIIGFDDFGLSRVTSPSITTMHVPVEEMARLATERLFGLIAGDTVTPQDAHAILPVTLVERQSCGC